MNRPKRKNLASVPRMTPEERLEAALWALIDVGIFVIVCTSMAVWLRG